MNRKAISTDRADVSVPYFSQIPTVIFNEICSYLTLSDKLLTVIRLSRQHNQSLAAISFAPNHLTITSTFLHSFIKSRRLHSLLPKIKSVSFSKAFDADLPMTEVCEVFTIPSANAIFYEPPSRSLTLSSISAAATSAQDSSHASFFFSSLTSLSVYTSHTRHHHQFPFAECVAACPLSFQLLKHLSLTSSLCHFSSSLFPALTHVSVAIVNEIDQTFRDRFRCLFDLSSLKSLDIQKQTDGTKGLIPMILKYANWKQLQTLTFRGGSCGLQDILSIGLVKYVSIGKYELDIGYRMLDMNNDDILANDDNNPMIQQQFLSTNLSLQYLQLSGALFSPGFLAFSRLDRAINGEWFPSLKHLLLPDGTDFGSTATSINNIMDLFSCLSVKPVQLTIFRFSAKQHYLSANTIAALFNMRQLHKLMLQGAIDNYDKAPRFPNCDLNHITLCHLNTLTITSFVLNDKDLTMMLKAMPHLIDISLFDCSLVTGVAISIIGSCSPHIGRISIRGCANVTFDTVASSVHLLSTLSFIPFTKLKILELDMYDRGLQHGHINALVNMFASAPLHYILLATTARMTCAAILLFSVFPRLQSLTLLYIFFGDMRPTIYGCTRGEAILNPFSHPHQQQRWNSRNNKINSNEHSIKLYTMPNRNRDRSFNAGRYLTDTAATVAELEIHPEHIANYPRLFRTCIVDELNGLAGCAAFFNDLAAHVNDGTCRDNDSFSRLCCTVM